MILNSVLSTNSCAERRARSNARQALRPRLAPGADRRLVLIGQAPNRISSALLENRPALAVTGRVGRRIAQIAGVSWWAYLVHTIRLNVLARWPGKTGAGDAFPMSEARLSAFQIEREFRDGQRIIYLGSKVAQAFGERVAAEGQSDYGKLRPLRWETRRHVGAAGPGFTRRALLPHPSGLNRWWNEPRNQRAAARFLRRAFDEARGRRS